MRLCLLFSDAIPDSLQDATDWATGVTIEKPKIVKVGHFGVEAVLRDARCMGSCRLGA